MNIKELNETLAKFLNESSDSMFADFSEEGKNRYAVYYKDDVLVDDLDSVKDAIAWMETNLTDEQKQHKDDVEIFDKVNQDTVEITVEL